LLASIYISIRAPWITLWPAPVQIVLECKIPHEQDALKWKAIGRRRRIIRRRKKEEEKKKEEEEEEQGGGGKEEEEVFHHGSQLKFSLALQNSTTSFPVLSNKNTNETLIKFLN
jgi:hypothetical protein